MKKSKEARNSTRRKRWGRNWNCKGK